MKSVILAAGRGKRMGELTKNTPKPLLLFQGKTLIEHKIEQLPEEVDEVILVVGYLKERIQNFFGDSYQGKKISYVIQDELRGTGDALWRCQKKLSDKFLVMMGDDLYSKKDIQKSLQYDWALLYKEVDHPISGLQVEVKEGRFVGLVPSATRQNKVNTGLYVLQPEVFSYDLVWLESIQEWGLPHTLASFCQEVDFKAIKASFWKGVSGPLDIEL